MKQKQQPVGICDLCLAQIAPDQWYTRRGPRLYCSIDCRNTGNSRSGAPTRSRKARQRVADGRWQNPAKLNPPSPEEQGARSRQGRLREVAEGRWRNPALATEAREKLSRPRRYDGALHRAIERQRAGAKIADLTDEEREAWREHRRLLDAQRRAARTPEQVDQLRAQWREHWHKRRGSATR